ncbi:AAA family ATPase [Achromobacter xylosoxidans]
MNLIENIRIDGLWGRAEPLKIAFNDDYNFLIGQNGTGKTTVINLLAAALTADFERLDRVHYDRIQIKLKARGNRKRPIIEIIKSQKENLPYFAIQYSVRASSSANAVIFDFDKFEEERFYRTAPPRIRRERNAARFYDIRHQLGALFNVRWLSINRASDEFTPDEEKRFASMVDRKVAELSSEIVKYLGRLTKRYADETLEFQQSSLLSLISAESEFKLNELVKSIDLNEERHALEKAFELLGVAPAKYQKTLNTHFNNFNAAAAKFGKPISMFELGSVYNALKAHYLVQKYNSLQTKRLEIFAPRDNFLRVFNELLAPRKFIDTSGRGDLVVYPGSKRPITDKDKSIQLDELSSGEKQLFIILGEALLQEQRPAIYIADEPELSLHIKWQEKLTHSIKSINPNAQIIFATHSPDIVGLHDDKIIDMETIGI